MPSVRSPHWLPSLAPALLAGAHLTGLLFFLNPDHPISLAALTKRGNVVLAFYPADFSGGCTKEVCSFRDNFASLSALNAQILGLSGDYVYSHHEWAKQHELPFALASDHDHAVGRRYSSYSEKSGYNKRTVYVIDKSGKIAYIDLKYSPVDPASLDKLKAALTAIQ